MMTNIGWWLMTEEEWQQITTHKSKTDSQLRSNHGWCQVDNIIIAHIYPLQFATGLDQLLIALYISTMQKMFFVQLPFGAPTEHYTETIFLFFFLSFVSSLSILDRIILFGRKQAISNNTKTSSVFATHGMLMGVISSICTGKCFNTFSLSSVWLTSLCSLKGRS